MESAANLLEIQYEKSRPTLVLDGSVLTRIEPRIATQYASAPEYARPFFQYVAEVTVQKITMTAVVHVSQIHQRCGQGRGGRTLDDAVDAAEERGLQRGEPEAGDDELALVAELKGRGASICQHRPSGERMSVRHTEFVTFLVSGMYSAGCKCSGMGEEGTHEMAAKKKNSHVFGSFRHSMNLRKVSRRQRRAARVIHSTAWRHSLVLLEVLVLDARLVHLDALDRDDALLGREEPRRRGRVGEEEPGAR